MELLKAARNSVKLVVRYTPKVIIIIIIIFIGFIIIIIKIITPKVLEEMEMRFDKQRQARRKHMYS